MRAPAFLLAIALLAAPAAAQSKKEFHTPEGSGLYSPMLPAGSHYIAPAVYEEWWREIAACEALPLPAWHSQVKWYQLNAEKFYDALAPAYVRDAAGNIKTAPNGQVWIRWALGQAYPEDLEIFVALPYAYDEAVIKHEMVHLLMYWARERAGHPPERFERCGLKILY